eukprot:1846274-Pyramimonas_sp.AAC.3
MLNQPFWRVWTQNRAWQALRLMPDDQGPHAPLNVSHFSLRCDSRVLLLAGEDRGTPLAFLDFPRAVQQV